MKKLTRCQAFVSASQGAPAWMVLLLGVVAVMLSSSPVWAQQDPESVEQSAEPVRASAEQRRLNDEAARAISRGDYTKAVSYLEEAQFIGELNVTFLNLGRAYQYMGRCAKARAALESVASAPPVHKPRRSFIEAKAREYLDELEEQCDESTESAVKPDAKPQDESPREARADDPPKQRAQPSPESPQGEPVSEARAQDNSALGWTLTAGGVALVGGAAGMHLWAESVREEVATVAEVDANGNVIRPSQQTVYEHQSRANNLDTAGLVLGVAGGAAVVAGAYWLLTAEDDEAPSVSVGPSAGGQGIAVFGRF